MKFSTATTTTNTSPAPIWEGIDIFTLILALLALALSLVVSRLRLTPLVFSGSSSRRLALCHLLHSGTHDSQKIMGNISSSKKSIFPVFLSVLQASYPMQPLPHRLTSLRWIRGAVGRRPHECLQLGVSIGASRHSGITSSR